MKNIEIGPYQDHQRRTCIVIGHTKNSVELIILDTSLGLRVSEMSDASFTKEYKKIDGYPLHKAIEQYIEFAAYCGMSCRVKDLFQSMLEGLAKRDKIDVSLALVKLQSVKILSQEEKKSGRKAAKREDDSPPWEDSSPSNGEDKKEDTTPVSGKSTNRIPKKGKENKTIKQSENKGKKTMSAARTTKITATTSQKNTGRIKTGKPSAAQMFRDLILSGSYDDDQIFKMVQKEYGLDDSKRNYVSYYRRELKIKGLI